MSHFYGTIQGTRGRATRCGDKGRGLHVIAASWDGCIAVNLRWDEEEKCNKFYVTQETWHGSGVFQPLAEGVIGKRLVPTVTGVWKNIEEGK